MNKRNCLVVIILVLAISNPAFAAWGKLGIDVRITNDSAQSLNPSIVWNGSGYGVCWEDYRDGNWEIYFTRMDSYGSKIGSDVRITNAPDFSEFCSLVWTGTEYGVSWDDYRDDPSYPEIYFARIDASGNKIGSDVRITNNTGDSYMPSLVWTGTEYGVSWDDNRSGHYEIYFARIDASGKKIGSDIRITNASVFSDWSSLVWTGTNYGVSWEDNRDGDWEIYFARIDASGTKIDSDVRITNSAGQSGEPSLVWREAGNEYGVSWCDERDANREIYFARIDSSGNKIGSDVRITNEITGLSQDPSLATIGSEYGVAWDDNRDGNSEMYFARIDSSGNKIGSDIRITNDGGNSVWPSLVSVGTAYSVSWEDNRDGNSEIYFTRIGDLDTMIPTVSEWGMIIMAVLLMLALAWRMRRRQSEA